MTTNNTTTNQNLWKDLDGRVCCTRHISEYHHLLLAARPDFRILFTPTTEWVRLTDAAVCSVCSEETAK